MTTPEEYKDLTEAIKQLQEENRRLKEALKGLMTNPSINLGDQIYVVRDHEGKGWNGPDVRAWSDAVKEATKLIEP